MHSGIMYPLQTMRLANIAVKKMKPIIMEVIKRIKEVRNVQCKYLWCGVRPTEGMLCDCMDFFATEPTISSFRISL